jgi:signal transduction histidine kinase
MALQDSYLQLATSIERRLRADLPGGKEVDLSASIDRALFDEAQRAELALTSLRLIVVAVAVVYTLTVCVGAHLGGFLCLALLIPGLLWGAASIALFFALRRGWYRVWLRHVIPVLESALSVLLCASLWAAARGAQTLHDHLLVFATALGAYLTFSGVFRLSRSSALLSTVLALFVVLVVGAMAQANVVAIVASMVILGVLGVVGSRAPRLVQRVVTNEIGRAMMISRYEEARQAIEAREQVLKIVSHDLRNPLHTIAMSTELLLEGVGSEDQQKRHVAIIRRAGDRMNRLVKDLLDVAKLESGRLSIQPRLIDVTSLLKEAEDMLHPLAAAKSLSLDISAAEDLPRIQADSGRVLQVLSNLVGNAIKFTPVEGHIAISARRVGSGIQFTVEDSGPGIPPEQLPHIFGAFWQADPTDRRGIGLGLTISKAIVEAHGGRLSVESEVGRGTAFHFTLQHDALQTTERGAAAAADQLPTARVNDSLVQSARVTRH